MANIHYTYRVNRLWHRLNDKKRFTVAKEISIADEHLEEWAKALPKYIEQLPTVEFTTKTGEKFYLQYNEPRHIEIYTELRDLLSTVNKRLAMKNKRKQYGSTN